MEADKDKDKDEEVDDLTINVVDTALID